MSDPYFVFLSHASADAWTARQLEKEIVALGAATFLSVIDIEAGDDFGAKMRDAMDMANECTVLYTPEAASSKNVWVEIGGAWMMRRRVVIVLCRITVTEVSADPRFPPYLKTLDFVDLNSELDSEYLPQLKARVQSYAPAGGA
jgi:hypothetical protein